MSRQSIGLNFLILLLSSSLFSALAFPNSQQLPEYKKGTPQQINQSRFERKFAEKPNAIKKVALDDLDDIQTNEISQTGTTGGGFSWSNLLGRCEFILLIYNYSNSCFMLLN